MKVLLVDVDSKMPNLALMKLSAWHKRKGDTVYLNRCCNPDKVYISCIFSKNRTKALGIAKMFNCPVKIGGSGVQIQTQLPEEIEHIIMPDYSLYGIRYSMGFTSRGCNRKCPWCIVPEKEGKIKNHAPIDEFYVPCWRKLRLLDNNFLMSPKWYDNLREIIIRKIRVDFNQGLDIRLVDQENAKMLAKCNYSDTRFKRRRLRFSFDLPGMENEVIEGINCLVRAGIKPQHLFFYMLCGYNTTAEEDYHRFELLNNLGVLPFIQIYNNRRDDQRLRDFARWVNKRFYNWVPWKKYDRHYKAKMRDIPMT